MGKRNQAKTQVPRTPPTKTHLEMVEEWKKDQEFLEAYDELEAEHSSLRKLIQASQRDGLAHAEIAVKTETKPGR